MQKTLRYRADTSDRNGWHGSWSDRKDHATVNYMIGEIERTRHVYPKRTASQ